MSKKETLEKFFKFMEKWHYEDFNAFENHFNNLMSMKSKEQLINENEALKDSIAVILAQKKNVHKHCNEKDQQIDQLKQQLAEKDKEINSLILDYEKRISQEQELMSNMEHRLTEKQNTIDEINKEFVQAVHDWKTLCAEKDKEIEKLKSEIVKECKEHQDFIKEAKQITNQLKSNYQTQLAIQELEKVNGILTDTIIEVTQDEFDLNKLCYLEEISARFYEKIQQQINDLRGEKDVKD